ncbi:hypothetical protein C8R42DRAFT_715337 [Lentinula raphanica]|nr:hypothetical protein C8R42DRAFT_715337 [Lentinula raphanica]
MHFFWNVFYLSLFGPHKRKFESITRTCSQEPKSSRAFSFESPHHRSRLYGSPPTLLQRFSCYRNPTQVYSVNQTERLLLPAFFVSIECATPPPKVLDNWQESLEAGSRAFVSCTRSPSSQDQSSEAYPYRNSPDVSMKQVHFDHKLFATARIPKRSTFVESPAGRSIPHSSQDQSSETYPCGNSPDIMRMKQVPLDLKLLRLPDFRNGPRLLKVLEGYTWLKKGSTLCASWVTSRVLSLVDDVISAMRQMDMIRRLGQLTEAIKRDPLSVDLSQDDAVHLAALRKKSLRELPEPLTTYKLWVGGQAVKNDDKRKRPLHVISIIMPKAHRDTMEILFVFLKWVASFVHLDEDEYPLIATPYGSRRKLQDNWSGDNLAGKIEKHSSPYQYHTTRNKGLNGRSPTPGDLVEGGRGGGIPSGKKGRTD